MRKLVIGMAMASSALASPAFARDDSWYIEGEAGPMIVEDSKFDVGVTPSAYNLDHRVGVREAAHVQDRFVGVLLDLVGVGLLVVLGLVP